MTVIATMLVSLACGYSVRLMQDRAKNRALVTVDNTWIAEARQCWKGFASWSDEDIRVDLAHPPEFRSAFPEYSTAIDSDVTKTASQPRIDLSAGLVPINKQGPVSTDTSKKIDYDALAEEARRETPGLTPPNKQTGLNPDPWKVVSITCIEKEGIPSGFEGK